ncbi:hypothetical protein B0O99DRAFT_690407 [Bisporella sp. PMI_857]|nr:hypothetical protein B0O99DRAFT_690407 [Bisporella sp. PMI_857]
MSLHRGTGIEDLSPEIWLMIFEEVYNLEPQDPFSFVRPLQRFRFVSRWFNTVVTPFLYRQTYLRAHFFDNSRKSKELSPQELANIRVYTGELVMPDYHRMDGSRLAAAVDHISRCHVLKLLKWHFGNHNDPEHQHSEIFPASVVHAFLRQLRPQMIYINIMQNWLSIGPYEIFGSNYPADKGSVLPSRYHSDQSSNGSHGNGDVELISVTTTQGGPFFQFAEPFPRMRELVLRNCAWKYTIADCLAIWDLSRLESLHLDDVPLFSFLESTSHHGLSNLRRLVIFQDFKQEESDEARDQLKSLFSELLSRARYLEELVIYGPWSTLLHKDFLKMPNLRTLRLRLQRTLYPGPKFVSEKQFSFLLLQKLQQACSRIADLELDVDLSTPQYMKITEALCEFPSLEKLSLFSNSQFDARHSFVASDEYTEHYGSENSSLKDASTSLEAIGAEIAKKFALRLRMYKHGTPFSSIKLWVPPTHKDSSSSSEGTDMRCFVFPDSKVQQVNTGSNIVNGSDS